MKVRAAEIGELPLFPLRAVLFPGGLLRLKVFESRYLDLIGRCLRDEQVFGVVCLRQGAEVRPPGGPRAVHFEAVGVLAHLRDVDAEQAGILKVSCLGGRRFESVLPRQQDDGLWLADARTLDDDPVVPPAPAHAATVQALSQALAALAGRGGEPPCVGPYRLDDASWVANRWCEILPIPLQARQRLMELGEPLRRLDLVDAFLRGQGVV